MSKMKKNSVTLSIPSRTEYLTAVRNFVNNLMVEVGWNAEQSAELEIALYEVLMNVVEHAYKMSPDNEVNIAIEFNKDEVVIEVEDKGQPFDSTTISVPNDADGARKKQMIGKYLIKAFTDRIEYKNSTKGGNILRIVKVRRP